MIQLAFALLIATCLSGLTALLATESEKVAEKIGNSKIISSIFRAILLQSLFERISSLFEILYYKMIKFLKLILAVIILLILLWFISMLLN